jgi:hypothetical protein
VLTDRALVFSPLDLEGTKQLLDLVFAAVQLPGEQVLSQLAGTKSAPVVIALTNIARAERSGAARLLSPPSVRVTTKAGSVHEFGVLAGFMYPNASKENEVALEDFLSCLNGALPAAA